MQIYFGDIHNHTTLSDGDGPPEACIEQARANLDFFAFSDHIQFADLPYTPESVTQPRGSDEEWREGVPALRQRWPDVQRMIQENNRSGEFVTFLGYEWSSDRWGDRNVYYLEDDQPLRYANSLAELYAGLAGIEAIVIPHHTAYPLHHRGCDWQDFDPSRSPVVEMFSFHGSSETDEGPYDFTGNPMGPRVRAGTAQRGLELGHVFGFIASSDNHHSFPGQYGMGLAAIFAESLTRDALWAGFKNRRTYAVTGDRIHLDFKLNGRMMGSIVPIKAGEPPKISIAVDGWDCLEAVEVLKNGQVTKRWCDFTNRPISGSKSFKVWIHWGYQSHPSEKKWEFSVETSQGVITGYNPCFSWPGYGKAQANGPKRVNVISKTGNTGKFGGTFQKLCVEVEASPSAVISILCEGKEILGCTIAELTQASKCAIPFGPYGGAFSLGRAVAEPHFLAQLEWEDSTQVDSGDYYYVRGFQANGQACWSSPIWVTRGADAPG